MEIIINIPKNDYVTPTEVRPEVVERICKAFLTGGCSCIYHPFNQGCYRKATNAIGYIRCYDSWRFEDTEFAKKMGREQITEFNGAEMAAAFHALVNAGYHIFRVMFYGGWLGYVVSKKPFLEGYERTYSYEVFNFTDVID